MGKLQNFSISLVMFALGVTALLYVIDVDRVIRLVAMMALGSLSVLGALVFFGFCLRGSRSRALSTLLCRRLSGGFAREMITTSNLPDNRPRGIFHPNTNSRRFGGTRLQLSG